MDHQKAVADAAAKLREAIQAAQAAGYRVAFPTYALGSIAVSETGRVAAQAEPEAPPVAVLGRRSPPPDAA